MALKVKYYHSGMRGAPTKSGTPGSSISILDAVLLNGFGEVTASSVTISGGRVRVVLNTGEGFSSDATVLVSGASVPSVNGEHTVVVDSATVISWPTTESDQAVTGTIKVKVAPLNWIKPFSGTNLAVYKSPALESSGGFLWVDDAFALYTRFATFETMGDANTGTGRCPATSNEYAIVFKSEAANTTPREWWIVGDDVGFYYCTNSYINYSSVGEYYFGDGVPDRSNDKFRFLLTGSASTSNGHEGSVPLSTTMGSSSNHVSRPISGLGAPMRVRYGSEGSGGFSTSGQYQPNGTYPAQTNNGLLLSRIQYNDTNGRRGIVPGIYAVSLNGLYNYFNNGTVIDGQKDMIGRKLLHLFCSHGASTNANGCGSCFIDITGPWNR